MNEKIDKINNSDFEADRFNLDKQINQILDQDNVKRQNIPLGNDVISEIIVLEKNEVPKEKMIRIYRGVNKIDPSLLMQAPYALRKIIEKDFKQEVEVMHDLEPEAEAMANQPTYEHLVNYVDKVRPRLSPYELEWLDNDLKGIEDDILKGNSTRNSLLSKQTQRGGGAADIGLAPYVSASTDPFEAARFGQVLLAIDVPVSLIADYGHVRNGEIMLKGTIDSKYITALMPLKDPNVRKDENFNDQIDKALSVLKQEVPKPIYSPEEQTELRQEQLNKEKESDKKQQQIDLELVRLKRADNLAKNYPEANVNIKNLSEESLEGQTDIYSKVKQSIFEYYNSRLVEAYSGGVLTRGEPQDEADIDLEEIAKKMKIKQIDNQNLTEDLLRAVKKRVEIIENKKKELAEIKRVRDLIEKA